jgi:hypothetical protein
VIGGEAVDLDGLLGRMVPDAIALVERVLQQAQEQMMRDGGFAVDGDTSPKEVIAAALGNGLARMIVNQDSSAVADWPTARFQSAHVRHYEELVDRNSVLASALGACDCWGHHVDCRVCGGVGGPGWTLPDEQLFTSYVGPALHAVMSPDRSSTVAET